MSMTREQLKHLKAKLQTIRYRKNRTAWKDPAMPKHVRAAHRIVESWKASQKKIQAAKSDRLEAAYQDTLQVVLFREAGDAIRAIQQFERFKL